MVLHPMPIFMEVITMASLRNTLSSGLDAIERTFNVLPVAANAISSLLETASASAEEFSEGYKAGKTIREQERSNDLMEREISAIEKRKQLLTEMEEVMGEFPDAESIRNIRDEFKNKTQAMFE